MTYINLLLWQSCYFNSFYKQQINDLRDDLNVRAKDLNYLNRQLNMKQ
jgi:hypothetical protein